LAIQCGADLIGLNFYPPSPRCVSLQTAQEIRAVVPAGVWCVGVVVNAEREWIASLVKKLNLHAIQFHGDETGPALQGWSCATIKALRVSPEALLPEWEPGCSDYLLLDTYKAERYGGTGEVFPWQAAAMLSPQSKGRLILAGGLTAENVAAAVQTVRPWAVDVASGVESLPGRKDLEKLRAFIANAKTA
jgi:phosphoribosylanthranilate isomerase